jgi:hypothetical protein
MATYLSKKVLSAFRQQIPLRCWVQLPLILRVQIRAIKWAGKLSASHRATRDFSRTRMLLIATTLVAVAIGLIVWVNDH